jgi:hypothetical protein
VPPDEGFGPNDQYRREEATKSPGDRREQPLIEGPKARTLDLPAQHDDLLAQEQVLCDQRGAGGQEREHEVSQKLQEGGHGSYGLTMGRAREEAYRDERPISRGTELLRRTPDHALARRDDACRVRDGAPAVRRYPYQSSSLRSDGMSLGSKSPSCVTSVAPTSSAAAAARRSIRPFSFPFDAKWNLRRA